MNLVKFDLSRYNACMAPVRAYMTY